MPLYHPTQTLLAVTLSPPFLLALAQGLKSQRKYFIITMYWKSQGALKSHLGLNLDF